MDYDYGRYCEILEAFMDVSWRDPDDLVIGEDISDLPEVKIIFDGYGDLEWEDENGEWQYEERGNITMESYAIFIHKDALTEGFEFPEHQQTPWALVHRPKEEVCIYAWYDVENDSWEFLPLEDRIDTDCTMTEETVMEILEGLYNKRFSQALPD
jgi:hypothetical protein